MITCDDSLSVSPNSVHVLTVPFSSGAHWSSSYSSSRSSAAFGSSGKYLRVRIVLSELRGSEDINTPKVLVHVEIALTVCWSTTEEAGPAPKACVIETNKIHQQRRAGKVFESSDYLQ